MAAAAEWDDLDTVTEIVPRLEADREKAELVIALRAANARIRELELLVATLRAEHAERVDDLLERGAV